MDVETLHPLRPLEGLESFKRDLYSAGCGVERGVGCGERGVEIFIVSEYNRQRYLHTLLLPVTNCKKRAFSSFENDLSTVQKKLIAGSHDL